MLIYCVVESDRECASFIRRAFNGDFTAERIAENPVSAIDYGHRLKKVLSDVSVIVSTDEFEKVIGCNLDSADYTRLYTLAKNLS